MKIINNKGQSAIETALVLPILLLILFAIIFFGIFVYNKTVVLMAASKGLDAGLGVRLNGMDAKDWEKDGGFKERQTAKEEAINILKLTIFSDDFDAKYTNSDNEKITMETSVEYKLSLPIINSIISDNNIIKSKSVYRENKPFEK